MKIFVTSFNNNPNIGLYGYCNDRFCIVGEGIKEDIVEKIRDVLKVPVHKLSLCGTSLIGVFCAGNSSKLLIPEIVFENELSMLDKFKIEYQTITTRLTAFGNNILCNDNGCLVNPEYSADAKKVIRKALDVPLKPGTLCGLDVVGSLAVLRGKHCLAGRGISEEEKAYMEDLLKVESEEGTVNLGSPFVSSGMLCNKNGIVISSACSGPEKAHISNVLNIR